MCEKAETIKPGVVMPDGSTYYPSGTQWLLAFALAGCKWAVKALWDSSPGTFHPDQPAFSPENPGGGQSGESC